MTLAPSATAKLSHARRHRDQLREQVEAFRAKDAYDFYVTQRHDPLDSTTVIAEYRVRVRHEPPTMDWSLTLGDVLTNLRAVLDHALYFHVTSRNRLTDKQLRKVEFPICEDDQQWSSWAGTPVAREWSAAPVLDTIKSVQPAFAAEGRPRATTLYALNALVNIDKHRACHVLAYSGEATFDRASDPLATAFARTNRGTFLTNGAVIATKRYLKPIPGSNLPNRYDFEGLAGYTEVVDLPGVAALPVLGLCDIMIDRISEVLDALAAAHSSSL